MRLLNWLVEGRHLIVPGVIFVILAAVVHAEFRRPAGIPPPVSVTVTVIIEQAPLPPPVSPVQVDMLLPTTSVMGSSNPNI